MAERSRIAYGAALGALAAALPIAALWGYTVDDALITARVAANIARGLGHRMNPGGPVVDAVTPLGYAWVLAAFARAGPLAAWNAARWLGTGAWIMAAAWLGTRVAKSGERPARYAALAVLALSAPLGAWASSGMETGLVTALATFGMARTRLAPLIAGLAAAWRPELVPWALVLGAGTAIARRPVPQSAMLGIALALAPSLAVAAARTALFGTPTPLAVLAKPSDLAHGAGYALGALLFTGAPLLLVAPRILPRLPGHERAVAAAGAVHFVAMALAGGDWMVLYRLAVPVLPGMVLVGSAVAERAPIGATAARTVLACVPCVVLAALQLPAARSVVGHRLALIEAARPLLVGAERTAAVDVGWVGVATDGDVVDLAGVTDPSVARLAGGHTTKRISPGFLRARGVDALVLLVAEPASPWTASRFVHGVEVRVASQAAELGFRPVAALPLGGTTNEYLILQAKDDL